MIQECPPDQATAVFYRSDNKELVLAVSDLKFKPVPGDLFVIRDEGWVVDKVVAVEKDATVRGTEMFWFRYDISVSPDLR